jgi:parallel beta-helix repeat protein
MWDDGYPSGGNYWSDYSGLDQFSGPYQNAMGSDGIGDAPYAIDVFNRDNYPLMHPWSSFSYDWTVDDDGPADFDTIQEAINNAADGDTVFVKAGTYSEHVVANKTVSLVGEDVSATIVDGGGSGNVFTINRNNVSIDSFTIQNSGTILGNAGLRLDNVSLCSISGNSIRDNFAGIWLEESSENLIVANNITENVDDGIVFNYSHNNTISGNHIAFHEYFGIVINWSHNNTISCNNVTQTLGPSHGDGINLWKSSHNTIFQNHVEENNRYGIRVEVQSNNNTISDNMIGNCLTGLQLYDSSNFNYVYENDVARCSDGIDINKHSTQNTVSNNTIAYNEICGLQLYNTEDNLVDGNNLGNNWAGIGAHGKSQYNCLNRNSIENCTNGVLLHDSDYNSVSGNNITDCEIAIHFEWLTDFNIVEENSIRNNHIGIQLEQTSGNIFCHNNIISNTFQVSIIEYASDTWDGGYPSGGNYWSDYTGIDMKSGFYQNETDSDGIGDIPYTIDTNNTDNYPVMAQVSSFDAGTWNDTTYYTDIMSNSTLSHFHFDPHEGPFMSFWVKGETTNETIGFCRVAIPKNLLWVDDGWTVFYGSSPLAYKTFSDENCTYLYFTYTNPYQNVFTTVTIYGTHTIPELPSLLLLPLFFAATLLAVAIHRRKRC